MIKKLEEEKKRELEKETWVLQEVGAKAEAWETVSGYGRLVTPKFGGGQRGISLPNVQPESSICRFCKGDSSL